MTARDFSRALADLMRDNVIKAQHYVDEHRDLEQLGMPIEIVRHALDRKTLPTAPGRAIEAWDGKGLLALHHARDNGKTHGAALWVRARTRAGKRTAWISAPSLLSFDAIDRALRSTLRAPAVVVDDIGTALTQTAGFQQKFAAWVQERGHLPTILTSNANTAQLELYIGARMVSRLRQCGKLESFEAEAGLRKPDHEQLDDDGRGKRWARAQWLLWRFGCEPDDRMQGRRVVRGYRVGDALEQARLELSELHALAMGEGFTLDAVEAEAATRAAEAARNHGLIAEWQPPEMKTKSKMDNIIELADRDVRRHARAERAREAMPSCKPVDVATMAEPASWAEGVRGRAQLRRLGVWAERCPHSPRSWRVVSRMTAHAIDDPKPKLQIKDPGPLSESDAWSLAARMLGRDQGRKPAWLETAPPVLS